MEKGWMWAQGQRWENECGFEDFILKNDEVLKTFPGSHFSEQR